MANLGDATLTLKTDTKDFDKGLEKSGGVIDQFGGKAAAAVAAAAAAVTAFAVSSVKDFAAYGDTIHKMSLRTGVGTEFLSEMGHVMEQQGGQVKQLEIAFKMLTKLIGTEMADPAGPTQKASDVMEALGLTMEDVDRFVLQDLSVTFLELMKLLRDMPNELEQNAMAMEVFGGAGTKLKPIIDLTDEALAQLIEEAHMLGIVLSEEDAAAAADMTDALDELAKSMLGLKIMIARILTPEVEKMVLAMVDGLVAVRDWTEAYPIMTSVILKAITALSALVLALAAVKIAMIATGTTMAVVMPQVIAVGLAVYLLVKAGMWLEKNWTAIIDTLKEAFRLWVNSWITRINLLVDGINFLIRTGKNLGILGEDFREVGRLSMMAEEQVKSMANTTAEEYKKLDFVVRKHKAEVSAMANTTAEEWKRLDAGVQNHKAEVIDLGHVQMAYTESIKKSLSDQTKAHEEHFDDVKTMRDIDHEHGRKMAHLSQQAIRKALIEEQVKTAKLAMDAVAQAVATHKPRVRTAAELNQIAGMRRAIGGVSSGEQMLMGELAAGGKLQVSATDAAGNALRNAQGGVIMRDATQQDINRMFKSRIEAPLPQVDSLVRNPNVADLVTFKGNPLASRTEEINLMLDNQVIDRAAGNALKLAGMAEAN